MIHDKESHTLFVSMHVCCLATVDWDIFVAKTIQESKNIQGRILTDANTKVYSIYVQNEKSNVFHIQKCKIRYTLSKVGPLL